MNDAVEDMMISIRYKAERSSRDHNRNSKSLPLSLFFSTPNSHSFSFHFLAISPLLLSELTTLQTSSNEFLRQFYSAILPPKIGDLSAQALATPITRAAKGERMKSCLEKGEERMVGLLERVGKESGWEGEERIRVEAVSSSYSFVLLSRVGDERLMWMFFLSFFSLSFCQALQPIREAVLTAIAFYNSRISGGSTTSK